MNRITEFYNTKGLKRLILSIFLYLKENVKSNICTYEIHFISPLNYNILFLTQVTSVVENEKSLQAEIKHLLSTSEIISFKKKVKL